MAYDRSTTPPAKRRAPKGSVVERSRVEYTAHAKSQRQFIEARLASEPEDDFPASSSGAVRKALDVLSRRWGWTETPAPATKRRKGGAR